MRRKRPYAVPAILYVVLFSALCLSGRAREAAGTKGTIFGGAEVQLSSGRYPVESETLTAVIKAEDVSMLGHFANLREANFCGSACISEITAWADQNPQVTVTYSVYMPDGSAIENNAETLDLSAAKHRDMNALQEAVAGLTQLKSIYFGTVGADSEGLTIDDLRALRKVQPEAEFDFTLSLLDGEVTRDTEHLDLAALTHEELENAEAVLSCMSGLKSMTLGSENDSLPLEDALLLCAAAPEAEVDYAFTLYGKETNLNAQELDFSHVEIKDKGEALRAVLPYMRNCKTVDMDTTGLSNETLAEIQEENPSVKIIWRIWFGENYSVRTDVERILASKPTVGGMIAGKEGDVLKYCTEVKYLDLGHNEDMTDLSFVANMPNLEVLIVAMTDITDISALASCPKLEYLELNTTEVTDLSPLANCKNLKHVNICNCYELKDISPLYDIPMERLWIGALTPVPADQVETMKSRQPDTEVNTTAAEPHGDCWRYYRYDPEEPKYYWVPRYEELREQLGYNYQEYSFYWLDPKCDKEAPLEYRGMFGKEVYGLD